MILYLDLNCFNRPFDDQDQERIARETKAILSILRRVVDGIDQLVWSAILDFENSQHPLTDRRSGIARWRQYAVVYVKIDENIAQRAQELEKAGFKPLDAAHLACAEAAGCNCFLSCDDRLLRTAQRSNVALKVQNPINYLEDNPDGRTVDQ